MAVEGPVEGVQAGPEAGPVADVSVVLSVPAGFGWDPDFNLIRTGARSFSTDLVVSTLAPATTATFYANAARPNNTGNGTTGATAEQAIWAALNDVSPGVHAKLYILGSSDPLNPTLYPWTKAWRVGTSANLHVVVVSDFSTLAPGYALSSTALVEGDGELGTWGIAGGDGPNVYAATLVTAPGRCIDAATRDADGVPVALTLQTSIALVEANPGSYYHAGGVLYVRTSDSRDPDADLRPLRGGTSVNGLVNGARTVYLERLSFEGGGPARVFQVSDGNAVLVDCDVTHGTALGWEMNIPGTTTNATRTAHLVRCKFISNAGDGAGYAASGANMTLRGFEWGCTYARNSGAGTDQGGSGHVDPAPGGQSCSIIRLEPVTSDNKSHGFADVGGCTTWILGGTVSDESAGVHQGDGGTAWIQGTVFSGNTVDLQTDDAAGQIYVSDVRYDRTKVDGPGTVSSYIP